MSQNDLKQQKNGQVRRTYALVRRTRGLFHFGGLSEAKVRHTDTMVRRTSGLTAKNLHFSLQNNHKSNPNPHHDPQPLNYHPTNLNDDIVSLINTGINGTQLGVPKTLKSTRFGSNHI